MKIQHKATNILGKTSHYLKSGVLKEKPVWFDVVGSNPPNIDLTKRAKLFDVNGQKQDPVEKLNDKLKSNGLYKTRHGKADCANINTSVNRVPKLSFLEDRLRDLFYHQHPWEFARPKTLIENKGDEYKKGDWSHMLQFHKPLDGESVVQRTVWLLEKENKKGKGGLLEAYDQARFEFYRLRMEEEMNSQVSKEESGMYGAIYPSTNIEWGLEQEQEHLDIWAKAASEMTEAKLASTATQQRAANGSQGGEEMERDTRSIWEEGLENIGEFEEEK